VQGCNLGCAGCFNPETHDAHASIPPVATTEIASWVFKNNVDGLTVTGGEPLQQFEGVLELGHLVRATGKSVVVLTGFTSKQVFKRAARETLAEAFDVVIAGPYLSSHHSASSLRGSSNKEFLFLTDRYDLESFANTPDAEVIIDSDGSITITGVNVPSFEQK
jgi:anaerobic ribonucleoside-triphosphate reductase activating protein